ncbi:hypothetical protein T265_01793 [Opisthorchis viverrini]|uniref:Uncharacterized protein n=1 Tax=Opisthorchis viverrini TaxID=6198 RepID=A0A074ZY43_OPIVI|nr:hypothetical protein T265_01793 [Opisthorchis viverrini]KER32006.1 hypothetical protein T265_01793 [Opisthorchis viverrini]
MEAAGDPKAVLQDISKFDKSGLGHVVPEEKVVLPSAEEIQHEKTEKQLLEEITHHPKLRRASNLEKNPLPTPEVFAQEKKEKQ